MSEQDCMLLPLSEIRPTEEVCPVRVEEVLTMITECRSWTRPICIEGTVGALLDGHHRFAAARQLGLTRVPVHVFDYAEVELASWRADFAPTRAEVLARAIRGELYPHKTTRHTFVVPDIRPVLISALMPNSCEPPGSREAELCATTALQDSDFLRPATAGLNEVDEA